jgi:hypothetical protein
MEWVDSTLSYDQLLGSGGEIPDPDYDAMKGGVILAHNEGRSTKKKGIQGTSDGRRSNYLSIVESRLHSKSTVANPKHEKLFYWICKAIIACFKLECTLSVDSQDHNVVKYCNNIIVAHQIGAFGENLRYGIHE